MSNNYFRFKQFIIRQDQCAMKVCTDACIFGAFIHVGNAKTILDIGTGTGLLSLMLSQKSGNAITAIEIDNNAARQAEENIMNSPWKEKIKVLNCSIQDFCDRTSAFYDLIVSNPPFFKDHLKSKDANKNKAKHDESLPFEDLISAVKHLLAPDGSFWILLPAQESHLFEIYMKTSGFHLDTRLSIMNSENAPVFRVISSYARQPANTINLARLHIKAGDKYTEEFKKLLNEFYLDVS